MLDAVNLAWKLAGVVRGDFAESILETYTKERHPVAVAVLEITRAQAALMRPDEQTSALREIVARLMDTNEGTRFFGEMMSGIRTRYVQHRPCNYPLPLPPGPPARWTEE